MIVPDIIQRSNRKTLSLSVMKDGAVVIKAPIFMNDSVINKFVEEKQHWIKEKLKVVQNTNNKFEDIIQYKSFLLYGNKYTLTISDIKKIEVNDNFQIVIPNKREQDKVLKYIKNWYKKVAKKILQDRLNFIESRIRLKSNSVKNITPRKLPNCISYPSENNGVIGGFIKFYQQDIDKLKNMTVEEQIAYKSMLIDLGTFYR